MILISTSIALYCFFNINKVKNETKNTYADPEVAFIETHKALMMVSENINSGMENASYLEEYEKSKNQIFKSN